MPLSSPFRRATLTSALAAVLTSPALATAAVDHTAFDALLKATVSAEGWVDYPRLQKQTKKLKTYIAALGRVDPAQIDSNAERIAFWLNAYNAVCLQTLIDHGLPASVPKATFFGKNIFTETTYRIAGKIRYLDDIEHGILRQQFKDNRIHAAVVCGAESCPRLRREAYTGELLDKQFTEEVERWVRTGKDQSGQRKNYLDRTRNIFYVSKIFYWFQEDFGDSEAGVLDFLKGYVDPADAEHMKTHKMRIK
jgi:hypothetical protein